MFSAALPKRTRDPTGSRTPRPCLAAADRSGFGLFAGLLALALAALALGLRLAGLGLGLLRLREGGAEDVAQAGARVGRAVLGHRLLVLVELARLDRERQLAGLGIDRRDLGVDLLADGEAVGPLIAALAREIGLADEAGNAVAERHLDPVVLHLGHRAGNDIALLVLAGRRRE